MKKSNVFSFLVYLTFKGVVSDFNFEAEEIVFYKRKTAGSFYRYSISFDDYLYIDLKDLTEILNKELKLKRKLKR